MNNRYKQLVEILGIRIIQLLSKTVVCKTSRNGINKHVATNKKPNLGVLSG